MIITSPLLIDVAGYQPLRPDFGPRPIEVFAEAELERIA
jgi:hypothetical protein